jgi:hypothetical protein
MTKRLTILHTNDIHGRTEGLARVATLVAETRDNTAHPVLYLDAGDIEETNTRLSRKATEQPKHYRGAKRGMLHLSGMKRINNQWFIGNEALSFDQTYTVASSDAEFNFSTSLIQKDWQLEVQYHIDVIMCEVLEKYMLKHKRITPQTGRIS